MGASEDGGRMVADHFDLWRTRVSIAAVATTAVDLNATGDRYDTTVGPLSATRLEFRGDRAGGAGLPVAANLVAYLLARVDGLPGDLNGVQQAVR